VAFWHGSAGSCCRIFCGAAQPQRAMSMHIQISIGKQTLTLSDDSGQVLRTYPVSTATKGAGEVAGQLLHAARRHLVRARIGAGQPENTVFIGRRPTARSMARTRRALSRARLDSDAHSLAVRLRARPQPPRRVDTMRRYVYIHGSPDTAPMGRPGSIGCIRMHNADIIELFDLVPPYTPVDISED
jgi:L,D-transpeptidase YbiS